MFDNIFFFREMSEFFPQDAIGYKKFWDCKETLQSALLNKRAPLEFPSCIGPILNAKDVYPAKDDAIRASEIYLGQLKSSCGILCSLGYSPVMKSLYYSNNTYKAKNYHGIWYFKTLETAIWTYLHPKEVGD